jgi:sporulation protein YlmC with PRC-barrel domain
LDRQLVDTDGRLVGKVDDIELAIDDSGTVKVAALLVGPGALGSRFGGRIGGWIVAIWSRLHSDENPTPRRISMADVVSIDSVVHVGRSVPKSDGELWVETYIVGRIPGAGHDPQ